MSENNYENLLESRKNLIKEIIRNIEINSKYEEESYKIGLYGEYGSGKSYFLNSFREFIENKEIQEQEDFKMNNEFKIININAWKDDFLHEPILSIGLSIMEEIKKDFEKNERIEKKINNKIKDIWNITKSFGKNILPFAAKTGINIILDKLHCDKNELKELIGTTLEPDFLDKLNKYNTEELYKNYSNYKNQIENVKDGLKEYIKELGENKKLLIIIDELDRCRPDYAIEFLESINHIFSVKDLIFLFAIDNKSLKSAFSVVYGNELNFDGYIKKFIDVIFKLDANLEIIDKNKYINNKIRQYNIDLSKISIIKVNKISSKHYYDPQKAEKIKKEKQNIEKEMYYLFNTFYKCNLRDINFIFKILNSNLSFDNEYYFYSLLFLAGLKTKDSNKYNLLFNTNIENENFIDINLELLKNILKDCDSKKFDKNVIGYSVFKNIKYEYDYDGYYIKLIDFTKNLEYEKFKNIFSKDKFDNEIKSYRYLDDWDNLHYNINTNKSILRQCYELIY